MATKRVNLALNRVEGDLELQVEYDGNRVSNAWCVGTMFRGFEKILKGRAAKDGLVITPRICGICGTAHLYAAVTALETAYQCQIAPNATRIRNLCLMAEEVQNDSRHTFLMFTVDFCNKHYKTNSHYPLLEEAFAPFNGRIYREVVQHTKKILEVVALFGGQWPHSSYMLPGGVTSVTNQRDLIRALTIVDDYIKWYEHSILGCSSETWLALKTVTDFFNWLEKQPGAKAKSSGGSWWGPWAQEKSSVTLPTSNTSAVTLFASFGRAIDLHKLGKGAGNLLSYGAYFDPEQWQPPFEIRHCLRKPGVYQAGQLKPFSATTITEHVKYSWYSGPSDRGVSPTEATTDPISPKEDSSQTKYSWTKAPRYQNTVVEVGPLAELVIAGDPLMTDFFKQEGSNVWLRQLARFHRPVVTLQKMRETILETLKRIQEPFYEPPMERAEGEGQGLIQAARGSLGHWIKLKGGTIDHYQIITPTTWNASPRDSSDQRGHWEQTLIGTEVQDLDNPVEIGHIVRSHDACLVCTVHFLNHQRKGRW